MAAGAAATAATILKETGGNFVISLENAFNVTTTPLRATGRSSGLDSIRFDTKNKMV